MSKQEIYEFLKEIAVCDICTLRYLNGRCNEFEDVEKAFENVCMISFYVITSRSNCL